jgi:hypothetical protein
MSAPARSCGPKFSPQGSWATVPANRVQDELRRAFRRWGLPASLRVDNGTPWGSSGDLPPDLALWLLGLGVNVQWNPPRRPENNGVVERSQGTAKRWAEPQDCATAEELQQRLAVMDVIQRQEYPSIAGRSRLAAFPGLRHSGRAYSVAGEGRHWSLAKVLAQVAGYVVRRRVDGCGKVSLYNRLRYVGTAHQGKDVYVMLDPERCEWVFADGQGRQLRSQPAEELTRERIVALKVTHRR